MRLRGSWAHTAGGCGPPSSDSDSDSALLVPPREPCRTSRVASDATRGASLQLGTTYNMHGMHNDDDRGVAAYNVPAA